MRQCIAVERGILGAVVLYFSDCVDVYGTFCSGGLHTPEIARKNTAHRDLKVRKQHSAVGSLCKLLIIFYFKIFELNTLYVVNILILQNCTFEIILCMFSTLKDIHKTKPK